MIRATFLELEEGPTIEIACASLDEVRRLRDVFAALAGGRAAPGCLSEVPGLTIEGFADVHFLVDDRANVFDKGIYLAGGERGRHLYRWFRSPEGWETAALLLDGILDAGAPGHQYLAQNLNDDAEIEVSFGGPHHGG